MAKESKMASRLSKAESELYRLKRQVEEATRKAGLREAMANGQNAFVYGTTVFLLRRTAWYSRIYTLTSPEDSYTKMKGTKASILATMLDRSFSAKCERS